MATEARYTAQINALIRPEPRDAMYKIADEHEASFADVLRTVIDYGLPAAIAHYAALAEAAHQAAVEADEQSTDPELLRAARRG